MIKSTWRLLSPLILCLYQNICIGQPGRPVKWDINANPVDPHETVLSITARIEPGWHLYSQFIKEGGPIPTRFTFEKSDAYRPVGDAEERGEQARFFDDIYEMEISWYTHEVSFYQRIKLAKPVTTIKGKIVYMVCNDQLCIPREQEFAVDVGHY